MHPAINILFGIHYQLTKPPNAACILNPSLPPKKKPLNSTLWINLKIVANVQIFNHTIEVPDFLKVFNKYFIHKN